MIITPRLRLALMTWFMRGAIAATRCAERLQVWVSHISQIMMAVWATSQRSICSETRILPLPGGCSLRLRLRRLRVPGTFGRLGNGASGQGFAVCEAAATATAAGKALRKNLLCIGLL